MKRVTIDLAALTAHRFPPESTGTATEVPGKGEGVKAFINAKG